jgi:hypothetical protein
MSIKKRLELIGWVLFSAGSGVFLTDSIIRGNTVVAVGSAAFLIGCIFFLLSEKF